MASVKDAVPDTQPIQNIKAVSKTNSQKQCDVKPKKKKKLLSGRANIWKNSKDDNGCFRLKQTRARSHDLDECSGNEGDGTSNALPERDTHESHRDWEKEGGKPKHKTSSTVREEYIPQERLVRCDQITKSQKLQKKHSHSQKSWGKKRETLETDLNETAEATNTGSSKKKENSNGTNKTKKKHSQRSKGLKTSKKNGKREHQSPSDSQNPRNDSSKLKKGTKPDRSKTRYHRSKSSKKRSDHKTKIDPKSECLVDDHPASDRQPGMAPFGRFPIENENDLDDLDPLSDSLSEVVRPFIEHFLSTLLGGILSPSSSDWDSDDDDDVIISNESNSGELDNCESSEDSDSCCGDLFCAGSSHRGVVSDEESSQPEERLLFDDCDRLVTSGYHSEHSAEDSDISEDDFIYRAAEDYDAIDPLMSSLVLSVPRVSVSVSVWEFIMHHRRQQFAEDTANILYENIMMTMLASHPELQNDGAPAPASEEVITALPTVVATKAILGNNTSCAICRSDYGVDEKLTQLPCKHMFHPVCVAAWLHKSGTCPVCRFLLQSSPADDDTG